MCMVFIEEGLPKETSQEMEEKGQEGDETKQWFNFRVCSLQVRWLQEPKPSFPKQVTAGPEPQRSRKRGHLTQFL